MIRGRLSEFAGPLSGRIAGPDVAFTGLGTDSRTLGAGELFLALNGPHHDGHEFVAAAQRRCAAAAVVERSIAASLPLLVVPDTLAALGSLAALWRARFPIPLVAVTGSNGKTTVKEMLLSILSRVGATAATRGNLNNEIGVPLCLFALDDTHRYAVMEMGANHRGEIARLCRIAGPTVAVVTCCAPAHLEGFGSVEGVARAKGEVFAGLGPDGVAVINQDDDFAPLWHTLAGERRRIGFGLGLGPGAEVTARLAPNGDGLSGSRFLLETPKGAAAVHLPLLGTHNVLNACAAAACAEAVGVSIEHTVAGLESVQAVRGRLTAYDGPPGVRVLDDSYNANPGSLRAALEVLAHCRGERWLVLGDMGELGAESPKLHRDAGHLAKALGVERLYGLGDLCRESVAGFGPGARHFPDIESLLAALGAELHAGVHLLVKGSRAMRMERVVRSAAGRSPLLTRH
ncbi:MAG: UDP-N-acetylmuramoyl-tripeptide--D-alanyl-D-alanine ligase [Gammaproteobacteria bacterium]